MQVGDTVRFVDDENCFIADIKLGHVGRIQTLDGRGCLVEGSNNFLMQCRFELVAAATKHAAPEFIVGDRVQHAGGETGTVREVTEHGNLLVDFDFDKGNPYLYEAKSFTKIGTALQNGERIHKEFNNCQHIPEEVTLFTSVIIQCKKCGQKL